MDIVYPPVVAAAKLASRTLGMRITVTGADNVPRSGGAVMACNHVSYLDFIFCGLGAQSSGRLVRFMAKRSVFHHRISGPLMRGMHHIEVDRAAGGASYTRAVRALKAGEVVGVFPEATISRAFVLKDFKNGAARMAMDAGVPLLPVVVWGGQRMMTKGRPRDLRTRGRAISIAVGPPVVVAAGTHPTQATAQLKAVMERMLDGVRQAHPDQRHPGEDAWWLPADMGGSAPSLEEARELDRRAGMS